MAVTSFTPLLGLALPTTGDLSGTWGTVVNDAITGLLDSAVAGTTTLSADTDVTLSTTNGAANQSRNAVIRWTASGTVTRNITAPAQSKAYIIINATGGTQSIVIRGAGPTTGVTVPAGRKALVAWNGSDFVEISGGLINLATDVVGVLPVANGGTGLSTVGTNGQVLQVVAGAPAWSTFNGLPSQTGNAGKWLTTDGAAASWQPLITPGGGGAIAINYDVVSTSYTVAAGTNGFSVGPITINNGVTVTVASGQRWVVI